MVVVSPLAFRWMILSPRRVGLKDGRTYRLPLVFCNLQAFVSAGAAHTIATHKIPEKGEGIDGHILPLGYWLSITVNR